MICYFERQMKELNHSIHSLDEKLFQRMIEEGVTAIKDIRLLYQV